MPLARNIVNLTFHVTSSSYPIVLACKCTTKILRLVSVNDTLNSRIRAASEEEQTDTAEKNIEEKPGPTANSTLPEVIAPIVGFTHAEVGHTPVDKSEEGIKEGAHQRKKI